jgi:hypothetical protein
MTSHPYPQHSAPVCDFCTTNQPVVAFDCRRFARRSIANVLVLERYPADTWTACATCAPLVHARSWDALATRCVNQQLAGAPANEITAVHTEFRDLFQKLGNHLTGRTKPFARA